MGKTMTPFFLKKKKVAESFVESNGVAMDKESAIARTVMVTSQIFIR